MSPGPRRDGAFWIVRAVLRCELRQLLRDRRALFSAVLLPALLYPLMFLSQNKLDDAFSQAFEETKDDKEKPPNPFDLE